MEMESLPLDYECPWREIGSRFIGNEDFGLNATGIETFDVVIGRMGDVDRVS
jgi:hypothetical protein